MQDVLHVRRARHDMTQDKTQGVVLYYKCCLRVVVFLMLSRRYVYALVFAFFIAALNYSNASMS